MNLPLQKCYQLGDVRTVVPASVGTNRGNEHLCLFVSQVTVPSVLTDESRCRNDTRSLEHGVNERKVSAAELVGQKRVDIEDVRENDSIRFADCPAIESRGRLSLRRSTRSERSRWRCRERSRSRSSRVSRSSYRALPRSPRASRRTGRCRPRGRTRAGC